MAMGDIETFHAADGTWKNRVTGGRTLLGDYDAREPAVTAGRQEARERSVEHIMRDLDGRVGECSSYGNDADTAAS